LLQQDAVGGLEAEVYGTWVAVPALPGAFVINIGELLQLVSNGYFRATPHRVVSPPKGVQRISIAYFFNPRFEAKIEPVTLPPALAAEAPGGESADPDNPNTARPGSTARTPRTIASASARSRAAMLYRAPCGLTCVSRAPCAAAMPARAPT